MKVSIVTPVYNDPRVAYSIQSTLSQESVSNVELIVVDGGSDEETMATIDRYRDDIDVLVSEPDNGIYDAMNKGISLATGDIIGILNADDRYDDTSVLQRVLNQFSERDIDVCYGDLIYENRAGDVVRRWKSGEFSSRRFFTGWMPPHPTVFVKRDIYDKYGTYDTQFRIAADYEFLLRIMLVGSVSTAYIDDVLVRMASGGRSNGSISNILKANREVCAAWRKHGMYAGYYVPVLKVLRKIPQFL